MMTVNLTKTRHFCKDIVSSAFLILSLSILLMSASHKSSAEDNPHPTLSATEVVKAFNAAMETMDFDTALQYVSKEVKYVNGPLPAVIGPEAIQATLTPFFAPIKENKLLVLRAAESGNKVFMERLDRHLVEGGWIELPVTGVYEVNNGRISYWRDYFDMATIVNAVPTPD